MWFQYDKYNLTFVHQYCLITQLVEKKNPDKMLDKLHILAPYTYKKIQYCTSNHITIFNNLSIIYDCGG